MAQEKLQLIITADSKEALKAIEDLAKSTEGLKTKYKDLKGGTSEATNAMVNFSRLAEDSAYGIRGAANNINPFIESLGRLKERAKESGTTIWKELIPTLTGPAGLAVAVSLVSAIYIKFFDNQKKVADGEDVLVDKTKKRNDELKKQKEELEQIYSSTAKEATQVSTLVAIIDSETESRIRKKDALKELQKINPEIFNGLKLEGDVVKGLNTAYKDYIDNLSTIIALKIKQKELEDVTEKILKKNGVTLTEDEKVIKNIGEAYTKLRIATADENQSRQLANKESEKTAKNESELNKLYDTRTRVLKAISELSKGAKITGAGGGGDTEKKDPFVEATKDFNNAVETNLELRQKDLISGKTYFDNYLNIINNYLGKLKNINTKEAKDALLKLSPKEIIKNVSDTYDADLEAQSAAMDVFDLGKTIKKGANIQGNEPTPFSKQAFENGRKEMDKFFKENKKNFDDADKQARQFAETLANTTTSAIRGMWESMKKGENVLDALGNAFLNLAEDIAFTIIKMEILKGLELALNIGSAAASGGATAAASGAGGFIKLLSKIFGSGMAEGGIVTGPTLTMVGEGNEHEAVMPLSKLSGFLNTSFNAGAMTKGGGNGGQFVLKGSDLVLALQRSNTNLNIRRGI